MEDREEIFKSLESERGRVKLFKQEPCTDLFWPLIIVLLVVVGMAVIFSFKDWIYFNFFYEIYHIISMPISSLSILNFLDLGWRIMLCAFLLRLGWMWLKEIPKREFNTDDRFYPL